MSYEIYHADCLEGMKRIPDGAVDMILTDLPYGITDCPFDVRIPFEPMWAQFKRVTKRNAAIVLFANGKFLIELAASNLRDYRYEWVWEKSAPVGFLNSNKMPLKAHENILVFYQQLPTYNPQFTTGKPYQKKRRPAAIYSKQTVGYVRSDGKRYPRDVIYMHCAADEVDKMSHPTQKPVDLLEYLIKTYSNEGELVLDATMGSGSTGVAAVNTGRDFIGFETEKNFYDIARERIDKAIALKQQSLF